MTELHQPLRMISLRGFSAGYAEKVAFEDLFLDFLEGQTTVLLGPGNSGKSTLLKILSNRHQGWQKGNLYYPWENPAYVPQEMNSQSPLSLRQAILEIKPRLRNPERQIQMHWKGCPQSIESLTKVFDTPICELPEAQQRLIAVTLTMVQQNELSLLDEPEVGLDLDSLDDLIVSLNRFKKNKTMIVVTHHLRVAREIGDFVVLMAYGRIIEAKTTDVFFTAPSHPYSQNVIRMGC